MEAIALGQRFLELGSEEYKHEVDPVWALICCIFGHFCLQNHGLSRFNVWHARKKSFLEAVNPYCCSTSRIAISVVNN